MRPTSSLSLLLFLQLSTAFPVSLRIKPQSQECLHSQPCNTLRTAITTLALSHSKPSNPRNPHFPEHQKLALHTFIPPTTTSASASHDDYFAQEGAFDNAPTTPSKNIPADEALSAATPLSTAYLQSLTRTTDEDVARPSMPTSALSSLRKEDARKYWEGELEKGGVGEMGRCGNSNMWPGTAGGYRTRMMHLEMGRRNDFMVVGIVVVFLMVVCALEFVERFGKQSSRRGEIFLEDDETYAFIVKKPRGLLESESGCSEKCVQETEYKEYQDDETIVDEDFNGDVEQKI
ncbi:hypothetical protein SBOR_5720 [Sclerotinia borealis F-4128]|uniref:Uncharacterized protein n=1 Tax=Sclerotinia borealis (strain F-4128) TaxID=1432307 RepID=W9CGN6_SCLBF|nr:hypothetical protein SBOR_5720 [Sclerotinia borealis F-4128]